jgi:hypothetical protein
MMDRGVVSFEIGNLWNGKWVNYLTIKNRDKSRFLNISLENVMQYPLHTISKPVVGREADNLARVLQSGWQF